MDLYIIYYSKENEWEEISHKYETSATRTALVDRVTELYKSGTAIDVTIIDIKNHIESGRFHIGDIKSYLKFIEEY